MAERRLSRWSRLKRKGGADAGDETTAERERAAAEAAPESVKLPGGARVKNFVPAMTPLAPLPEDDDDRLTRGVGYVEEDAAPAAAAPDAPGDEGDGEAEEDIFAGIEERELSEEEQAVVAELPPLDSMTADSDFTPYLRDGVPEFLKRRALRMLWRLNPFFNLRDGLNDYDEDYRVIHTVIDEMVGSYKVGRGHLSEDELRDMMPEEARRAFDEESEEDAEGEAGQDAEEDAGEDSATPAKNGETSETETDRADPDDDCENVGDGEDDVST